MSAYICNPEHLGLLAVCVLEATASPYPATKIARILARENIASVAYRYPNDTGNGDRPGPCLTDDQIVLAATVCAEHYLDNPVDPPAKAIVNLCRCYRYQACEHPGWETSEAKALVEATEAWALKRCDPRPAPESWGWEDTIPEVEAMYEAQD